MRARRTQGGERTTRNRELRGRKEPQNRVKRKRSAEICSGIVARTAPAVLEPDLSSSTLICAWLSSVPKICYGAPHHPHPFRRSAGESN